MFRIALAIAFSLPIAAHAGTVTIFDGDFSQANWSQTLVLGNDTVSSATASTVATGGNPGAFFQIDSHLGFVPFHFSGFPDPRVRLDLIYLPTAVAGPITSAIVSFDLKLLNSNDSFFWGGMASQGGTDFKSFGGDGSTLSTDAWTHYSADLTKVSSADFTGASGPTQFGLLVQSTNPDTSTLNTYDTSIAVDNFQVVITTADVPEPATLTLLAAGLAVAPVALRRRRRRR